MNQNRQLEIIEKLQGAEIQVLKSKGHDYADEDVLKNFKQVAEICRILNIDSRTLQGTHLFYIILKIQRICNLLNSGKTAKNEAIDDSFLDLRNYIGLLMCTLKEEKENERDISK